MKVRDDLKSLSLPHRAEAGDISFEGDPGLTKQEFKKDCDVNEILKRCVRMGVEIPAWDLVSGCADVSEFGDYSEMVRRVDEAEAAFARLPAELRGEFDNDPGKLLAFLHDPANEARAVELGLLRKPSEPPAPVVPAAPAAAAPPAAPQS